MAFPQGVNFRSSPGYVTDGPGEHYELGTNGGSPTYPRTTPQGNTIGTEGGTFSNADRNSSVDRRLAGIIYTASAGTTWRIDLPAPGAYAIRLAAGDYTSVNRTEWAIYDDLTKLTDITTGAMSATPRWKDANNVEYDASTWPSSNTPKSFTFASTICRLKSANATGNTVLSHFYIEAAGGGVTDTPVNPAAGSVSIAGYAPSVVQSVNRSVVAGAGGLTIVGYAPTVTQSAQVTPDAGSLSIAGFAPSVAQVSASPSIEPGAGTLSVAGYAPTVQQGGGGMIGGGGGAGMSPRKLREWLESLERETQRPKKRKPEPKVTAVAPPTFEPVDFPGVEVPDALQTLASPVSMPAPMPVMKPGKVYKAYLVDELAQFAALQAQRAVEEDDEEAAVMLLLT